MKVALCCIVKDENKYLVEFVEHYKNIGFSHIYIYDHNDKDGEHPEEVLQPYIDNNFVTVVDFRELPKPQILAYKTCYNTYNKLYDWMCFWDADEFLEIKDVKYKSINDFLSQNIFDKYDGILVNWETYGDNEQLHYSNEPVQYRFKKIVKNDMQIYSVNKPIIRCNINMELVWDDAIPYSTVCCPYQYAIINNNGKPVRKLLYFCNSIGEIQYVHSTNVNVKPQKILLKHYVTKSTEEYVLRKLTLFPDQLATVDTLDWDKFIEDYFRYNEFTMEKFRLIQKLVNEKYEYDKI